MKMKKKGKKGFISLKLDISKAYHRIEWDYLELTITTLGFPLRMINFILHCIKITTFFILVKGIPKGPIVPSRGLRQGDSLSPYLFFLCMEGLITLRKKLADDKCLEGVRVCQEAPMIYHLLFMDDSLIFCKENKEASQQLLALLNQYALALGQCINTEKITMVFSRNVQANVKEEIMAI